MDQEPQNILGLLNFIKDNMATTEELADAEYRLRVRFDIVHTAMNRVEDKMKRRSPRPMKRD